MLPRTPYIKPTFKLILESAQGKLDVASLRAVTGQVDTRLTVFVEDKFAATWVRIMLQNTPSVAMDALEIHPMKGDGIAVGVHCHHNINPSVKYKSICIIDGDSQQKEDKNKQIFQLPGQCPERYIYDKVLEKMEAAKGELTVALLRPFEEHDKVRDVIISVGNTNRDPHLLFSQVGRSLGFIPEDRVSEAFLTIWTRYCHEEMKGLVNPIDMFIPKETDSVSLSTAKGGQPHTLTLYRAM